MQTKSNIQLIREYLEVKRSFRDNINSFMDKYILEDSFFSFDKNIKGNIIENTKGYFSVNHEYTDIDEAIDNMTDKQSIRIIENKRFQIGTIYNKLSEAQGDKIIDITAGIVVEHD